MYRRKGHIHFIGIGGIGMSGIAKILKQQGYEISGCDADLHQKSVIELVSLGCHIFEGNNTSSCNNPNIDIMVYSSAIRADNLEITNAQLRGIPTIPRALMLAELMRTKYSIAVAGAHGKTTTTSLISHILIEAKKDPTVIIGGHLKNISTNARFGEGDFLVAEADESDRSFLHLQATLAIVTNIDLEHLETYTDLADIKETYKRFLDNLPFYGKAFLCTDDANIRSLFPLPHLKTVTYSLSEDSDFYAQNIILEKEFSTFTVHKKHSPELHNPQNPESHNKQHLESLGTIMINMPGRHNVLNALASVAICLDLEVPFETIAHALATFKGIERRFSYHGTYRGADVFDDYGHHPVEIYNTLLVARKRTKRKLIVAFQPHRYTRTHKLWDQFIQIFNESNIDHLIITDIYAASEQPIPGITSQNFALALMREKPKFTVTYAPYESNFDQITQSINTHIQEDDLLLLLGAGKINNLTKQLTLTTVQVATKNKTAIL